MAICPSCKSIMDDYDIGVCAACARESTRRITIIEPNYKDAYDLLMEYWDCIPENEREELHAKLEALGV